MRILHVKPQLTIHPIRQHSFLLVRRVVFPNGLECLLHQHWDIREWVLRKEPFQLIRQPLLLVVLYNDSDIVLHRLLDIEQFTSNRHPLQIVVFFCHGNRGALYIVSGKSDGQKIYEEFEEVPIRGRGYSFREGLNRAP